MDDLQIYYDNTRKPWGKLFYQLIWHQLSFAKNIKILDFGSGFGITANYLSENNEVTAIEPNAQMCKMRLQKNFYHQIVGGIEALKEFHPESFELIICHNVLEYVERKEEYIAAFSRILKKGGKISLVKHNHMGRVMQKAIFENNPEQALQLLEGKVAFAQNFGEINYYDTSEINKWKNDYSLVDYKDRGVRIFFALHPDNSIKQDDSWLNAMFELEKVAAEIDSFKNIAFYHHIVLEKS